MSDTEYLRWIAEHVAEVTAHMDGVELLCYDDEGDNYTVYGPPCLTDLDALRAAVDMAMGVTA